jgi:hypothetical protein
MNTIREWVRKNKPAHFWKSHSPPSPGPAPRERKYAPEHYPFPPLTCVYSLKPQLPACQLAGASRSCHTFQLQLPHSSAVSSASSQQVVAPAPSLSALPPSKLRRRPLGLCPHYAPNLRATPHEARATNIG